jgi:hypothetical protein
MDLKELIQHLHVLDTEALLSPEVLANIRKMRNWLVHTNDLLILGAARDCDLGVAGRPYRVLLQKGPSHVPRPRDPVGVGELGQAADRRQEGQCLRTRPADPNTSLDCGCAVPFDITGQALTPSQDGG